MVSFKHGVDGGVVVARMHEGTGDFGFDASTNTWGSLLERGILDPTKVVRTALENAVSVASVLLLTEATLTELPEIGRIYLLIRRQKSNPAAQRFEKLVEGSPVFDPMFKRHGVDLPRRSHH